MKVSVLYLPLGASMLLLSGCLVGPNYQRPSAPVTPTYKEAPPTSYSESKEWSQAHPNEAADRGKWWQVYNDATLDALEDQVAIGNQNLKAYEAQYLEARDVVRAARASLRPTVSLGPAITASGSGSGLYSTGTGTAVKTTSSVAAFYSLPVDVSWTADIWGSIRRTVRADIATAQADAAQVANARLSYQASLASDYFLLRGQDATKDLLEKTVKSYAEYLQLTRDRYDAGVASDADVAQAEAQLEGARASLVDVEVNRTAYEHAIAILTGKPPAEFSVEFGIRNAPPPRIPEGVPSALLQRRPDIALYERQVAAANEEIGVAKAAYYPTVTLSAGGGLQSTSISNWFTWPARYWSAGPSASELIYDGGRRRAQVAETQHAYDATVANYRQTVLTAFQQVEDYMAALRVLENEQTVEARAVSAATRSLDVSTEQYKAGTVNYLNVLSAQTVMFGDQLSLLDILTRRLTYSVSLIEALGGGWDASELPSSAQVVRGG
jgi:NodT family efflux transporter outer membrane factor (OMF) lipoprotein